jgi:hypothetical protein
MYWEINSNILRKRYPGLLNDIINAENDFSTDEITIGTAASGAPTLRVRELRAVSVSASPSPKR